MATSSATRPARSLPSDLRAGLGWGARVALLALMTWTGSAIGHPSGPVVGLAIGLGLGLALLGLGSLGLGLLRWVAVDWARVLGSAFLHATIGAAAMLLAFASVAPLVALTVWGAWLAAGTGLALAVVLVRRSVRVPSDAPNAGAVRGRALLGAALAASLTAAVAAWWWWPGSAAPVPPLAAGGAPHLTLPDPGAPGQLPVATLRYGSGLPGWRPEYGAAAALRTTPVDLADLVRVGPVARPARRAALGFDLDAVPRNAVVWYPGEGEGPFPLMLVAHGNANLFVASEEGYGWLGEHLASHGFVVVSIDAAAFNALPIVGGLRGENDARALLMLAHLDLWRRWEAAGEPAVPRVDLSRVALAGHSRGGEAAALAAELDRLGRLPEDARAPLRERVGGPHGVQAVVAIAPSDGQYRLGDRPTALHGVDYLVLHGGFDGDVSSFVGERQYERAAPGEGGFKAAVYLHHANHGQFNERWGRHDQVPPLGRLLRTAPIMGEVEQQRAGAALIGAFLRASLLGEEGYRELFRDPRRGLDWLPATAYVTRTDDGRGLTLLGAGAAVDPGAGSLAGSVVTTEALALWRVGDPGYRDGVARDATVVTLGWDRDPDEGPPTYRLRFPVPLADLIDEVVGAPDGAVLTLEIGRGLGPLPGDVAAPTGALDLSVALADEAGEVASRSLAGTQGVPPHLPTVVTRLAAFEATRYRPEAYPLFQRVDLPLADLSAANPALDLARTFEIALVFDQVPAGVVALRSLGLGPAASPR
jgi:dienelactone hydrolase